MFTEFNTVLYNVISTMIKHERYIYAFIVMVVVLWCQMRWQYRQFYRLSDKIKGPPSYPLKGSIFNLRTTPEKIMYNFKMSAESYDYEPVKLWVGPFLFIGVYKPEDVQIVLNSSKALEKGIIYHILRHAVGEGVFTAPIHKWKKHRRIIATIFSSKFLDQLYPIFNENNKTLIKNISKHVNETQPFDIWNYIISCNLNNISQTAMGYNLNDKGILSEFVYSMKKVLELSKCIVKPVLYIDYIFYIYTYFTGLNVHMNKLNRVSLQIIRDKKLEFNLAKSQQMDDGSKYTREESNRKSTKVFLDKLLKLNDEGADFTDEDLKNEVITIAVAGSDTSAISECFCILLLAMHQDVQDKVYNEICSVLGDSDRDVTPDDILEFKYLEMVLKETLRLFPPGAIFSRKINDNLKISSNLELPKGCNVFVSPYVTHRCPKLYPDPDSFNPENFNPENEANRHKFSFLAFSGGPRGCLGVKYAMISMKLMVVTLLRHYSVHTDCKLSEIKLKIDLLAKNADGYAITIRPRIKTYKPSMNYVETTR